jgi:hypothetical protein
VLARQAKEVLRERDRAEQLFLGKSIQRALAAFAEGRLKPNLEAPDGHFTVYLEDSAYFMTCRFLAPGEQGTESGDGVLIARLEPPLGPPPY